MADKKDLTPIDSPLDTNPKSRRPERDPVTGLALRQDGNYWESSGSGEIKKIKIIPPADMADLVKNGLAPYELPNWNKEDPNSSWYLPYRKLSPERREIFLSKLEQTGRIGVSAYWAGVSRKTIREHRKADPEFDEACETAADLYKEMVATSLTHQARVGQIDERWDSNGKLLSRRVSYEQQMRIIMLKQADPSYNDIQKQEVSVVGGAVVVPAPIDSVESWEDVVRRHTGSPAAGPVVAGTHSLGGGNAAAVGNSPLAVGQGPDAGEGNSAISEGRVVKRAVVDTTGENVGGEDDKGSE